MLQLKERFWRPLAERFEASRERLLACFVVGHMLMVICGALNFAPWIGRGVLGDALVTYGDFTGSRYSYGFFAPNIPNQVLAVVTSSNEEGVDTVEVLGAGTGEIDHRMATMMTFFTVVETDDLHAVSLAGYAFGRHPEAAEVAVSLRCYKIPSMQDYRQGVRPSADEYYRGVFARRADVEEAPNQ
jgi:hypothetical protein